MASTLLQDLPDHGHGKPKHGAMSIRPVLRMVAALLVVASLVTTGPGAVSGAPGDSDSEPAGVDGKVYVVATSHLDTQWWWTLADTILELLPATFTGNLDLLERYFGFHFSFEGSFRYLLLREYYPDLWDKLLTYVQLGRWSPAGSSVESGDTIVPSPESILRQFLYGNGFFRDELGVMSNDVFLPDSFGFPWSLPSVAAHCGIRGFSTAKLEWGSSIEIPFDVGLWKGPDGGALVAALNPGGYNRELPGDPGELGETLEALDRQEEVSGLRFRYMYFGIGDQGGGVPEASVAELQQALADGGDVTVVSACSGQMFDDITDTELEALPVHEGELLMRVHGTGTYTAQAAMKRWNRRNESLADAAERASAAAAWLGGRQYPGMALRDDWVRFLSHQFHDDLTGTSIPQAYRYSWNDLLLTQGRFAGVLSGAVGTVARALETGVEGTPVVVFNPLSRARQDVVELTLPRPTGSAAVRVFDPDGTEVPSQVVSETDGEMLDLLFLASAPSVGFVVYDVRPSSVPFEQETGVFVSDRVLENSRYRVELDENGDVASVFDRVEERELLATPLRIEFFNDLSIAWPAWEILYQDLLDGPRQRLTAPAVFRVVEKGPVRSCLEVRRSLAGSTFVQRTCLAAGDAGDRVEVDLEINWATEATLAKLAFPLAVKNEEVTYDLGLGTIRRPVNRPELYEVPAQMWVDLTDSDGSYGVSISTDCKYGWDRPDENTIRLTLLHTPVWPSFDQHTMDFGPHRMAISIQGHAGDWRNGAFDAATRLNQPLAAFVTRRHEGIMGRSWSFLSLDRDSVDIKAIKGDEAGDGLVIVRLQELEGKAANGVALTVGDGVVEAHRMDGMERVLGPLPVVDGRVSLDMGAYGIATVGVRLKEPESQLKNPASLARMLELPWDTDVVSSDGNWADGDFDGEGRTFAGELWPATLVHQGIPYRLGPSEAGKPNAVVCAGQDLDLGQPLEAGERVYLLVAATQDLVATLGLGDERFELSVPSWTGFLGQWVNRVGADGEVFKNPEDFESPYYRPDPVALYGTHHHSLKGNEPYKFTYLFRKVLEPSPGATHLVLPDEPRLRLFAVTVLADPADDTRPATRLFDGHDPAQATGIYGLWPPEMPTDSVDPDPEDGGSADGGKETTEILSQDSSGLSEPGRARSGGCHSNADCPASTGECWLLAVMCGLAVLTLRKLDRSLVLRKRMTGQ